MPPKKQPTVESGGTRVTTRPSNANKHPGTEAKKASQVQNRRDPEVIKADKEKKRAAKEAKEEAREAEAAQKETAQQNLDEYRAHLVATLEHEDKMFPQQLAKGGKKDTSSNSEAVAKKSVTNKARSADSSNPPKRPTAEGEVAITSKVKESTSQSLDRQPRTRKTSSARPAPTPVASSTVTTRGQKRKSDNIAPSAGDDEQPVAGTKKAKTLPSAKPSNPPQVPQRPTPRLKAQPVGQIPTSSSISGAAQETAEKQAATRKRPAEGEAVDDSALVTAEPPSKKLKGSTNKPQALRRTETLIGIDSGSVKLRRKNGDKKDIPVEHKDTAVEHGDTDTGIDSNVAPYKTPTALKKKKMTVIESSKSDSEGDSEIEEKLKMKRNKGATQVSVVRPNPAQKLKVIDTSRPTVSKKFLKSLDHTTDSGSLAGSESRSTGNLKSSGSTRATVSARTTASHDITTTKAGNLLPKKNKGKGPKGKQKETAPEERVKEPVISLSDEDESREREAALSSPIKGKTSRELNKAILMVTNDSNLLQTGVRVRKTSKSGAPIPNNAEPKFSGIILPTWLQKFASGDNPWRSPNDEDRINLETLCEIVLGDDSKIDISEHSGAWKKCSGQESQYRHRMKTLGFDSVLEDFNSVHDDDPDAMKNAQKIIEYGEYWCAPNDWKFMYGRIEDDGTMEDIYMGPLIIKTFAAHYSFTTPSKILPNYDVGVPIGGIALAVSAVEHTLKMFRDDRLEYKNGTLQVKMPETSGFTVKNDKKPKPKRTTKFDFSGTNYETCTLGHVACLEAMLEEDPELIESICKQARDIAGVRKPQHDHDNNDKYATLQTDPEFLARASLFKKGQKRNVKDATHKDNEESKGNDEDLDGSNDHDVNGKELEGTVDDEVQVENHYGNEDHEDEFEEVQELVQVNDRVDEFEEVQVNDPVENHHGNGDIGDEDIDSNFNADDRDDNIHGSQVGSDDGNSDSDTEGENENDDMPTDYGSQVDE